MGIGIVEFNLLRLLRAPLGDVITIGVQDVTSSAKKRARNSEPLLALGATTIRSIDISPYEGCDFLADLSLPNSVSTNHPRFSTICDFGSMEHVVNPIEFLRNLGSLIRPGGTILHSNPANGSVGHGYFQFSPEFFFSAYKGIFSTQSISCFLVDRKKPDTFWKVEEIKPGTRLNVRNHKGNIYVCTIAEEVYLLEKSSMMYQQDYLQRWDQSNEASFSDVKQKRSRPIFLTKIKGAWVDWRNLQKSGLNKKIGAFQSTSYQNIV